MNENWNFIFKTLGESGKVEGFPTNFDEFTKAMESPENRQFLLDIVHKNNIIEGFPQSLDEFDEQMGLKKKVSPYEKPFHESASWPTSLQEAQEKGLKSSGETGESGGSKTTVTEQDVVDDPIIKKVNDWYTQRGGVPPTL